MVRRTSLHNMISVLPILALSGLSALGLVAACSAGGGSAGQGGSGNAATSGSGGSAGSGTGGMGTGGMAGAGGSAGMSGTGGGPMGCQSAADCANDPKGPLCNTMTGQCAECIPSGDPGVDDCGVGQYCNVTTGQCEAGCTNNADCAGSMAKTCDLSKHVCTGCVIDTDCNPGSICVSATCVQGCSNIQPCQAGYSCCGSTCFDLADSETNCGFCQNVCPAPSGGEALCENGLCTLGTCLPGFADCNQNPNDGCEWNVLVDGACSCVPGQKQPCYQGLAGTAGIGACKAGTQTCKADGSGWGACAGQVLPKPEVCANNIDDDCNGLVDENVDLDGDGFTSCGGDCCDSITPFCKNPKLAQPGGFEYPGDGEDNDCDPSTPDTAVICSTAPKFAGVTGEDVAKAMDLCVFTTANSNHWGVLSAEQLLSDGTVPTTAQLTAIQDKQSAVLAGYGANIVPNAGPTFAGLSTGIMRDQDDAGYAGTSSDIGTSSSPPAAYLLANGGKLPSTPSCNGIACPVGTGAKDPVLVRLKIKTPKNAKSFTYDFRFFSSEYWTYQCTQFNDFFLALYQSTWTPDPMANPPQLPLPLDKNVAIGTAMMGMTKYPISVNNSFFDVCAPKECSPCTGGFLDLAGTGMQLQNTGGGTRWLKNDVPIAPGETITLDLMIFDVQDANLDSLVLLDNFTWNGDVKFGVHL